MKKGLLISLISLMVATTTSAQRYSGILANVDGMTIGDMANLSQTQFQFGTARSMAMAGALSSLGADASTMSTNPAGVGLYQRSEVTITPLVTIQKSESNATQYGDNSTVTPALGNFSMVIAMPYGRSERGLMAINFGVGYNRLTDLNSRTSLYSTTSGSESSIGQFFSNQLNDNNLASGDVTASNPNFNVWDNTDPNLWGAALGYQVGLANIEGGTWSPSWIGSDATVGHYLDLVSEGSVGEYDISVAANISNKLYIGMTFGIVRLRQEISLNYSEDYTYSDAPVSDNVMHYSHYNQSAILSGTGVNFKLGVIYRPVEPLRLSFAVHTPTAYSINRDYQAAAASYVDPNSEGIYEYSNITYILEDYYENGWCFKSPTRLLFGASYMLGNRALLSIDYQRDWYNSMRMTAVPYGVYNDYDNQVKTYYKGTNTVRLGGEFRVTPAVSLRGGYGYASSIIESGQDISDTPASPTINSTKYYSAGMGFTVSKHFTVDFAYMLYKTSYSDFQLYDVAAAELYSLDFVRHNIAMTTSFKF